MSHVQVHVCTLIVYFTCGSVHLDLLRKGRERHVSKYDNWPLFTCTAMFILCMCPAYFFDVVQTIFAIGGMKIIFGHMVLHKPGIEIRVLRMHACVLAFSSHCLDRRGEEDIGTYK